MANLMFEGEEGGEGWGCRGEVERGEGWER